MLKIACCLLVATLTLACSRALAASTSAPATLVAAFEAAVARHPAMEYTHKRSVTVFGGKEALSYGIRLCEAPHCKLPEAQRIAIARKLSHALASGDGGRFFLGRASFDYEGDESSWELNLYYLLEKGRSDFVVLGGALLSWDSSFGPEGNFTESTSVDFDSFEMPMCLVPEAVGRGWVRMEDLPDSYFARCEYMRRTVLSKLYVYSVSDEDDWQGRVELDRHFASWMRFALGTPEMKRLEDFVGSFVYGQITNFYHGHVVPITFKVRKTGQRFFALYDLALKKFTMLRTMR